MDKIIIEAAKAITEADVLFISAGAGMGVDSGLPDFRGNEGFWNAYPALKDEKISFYDLANPSWFSNDPGRAWGFYGHRFNLYKKTKPHQGFRILLNWALEKESKSFVFTSNVDGHFQKAGFSEEQIYECHGSINYLQCSEQCCSAIWPLFEPQFEIDPEKLLAIGQLPKCKQCTAIARPNILMFGDWAWISRRSVEQGQRFNEWQLKNAEKKIVTIEIGAGEAIPTVRLTSEALASRLIRINPREPHGPKGTISIALKALEALKAIDTFM